MSQASALAGRSQRSSGRGYIVFSDDWGDHPSSCQHLFRHIAARQPVLWVNTVGMRRPRLSLADVRKGMRKLGRMMRGTLPAAPPASGGARPQHLEVCAPPMLPYASFGSVRRFNRLSVSKRVRRATAGFSAPVVVTTVPNACDYVDTVGGSRIVYYCVDDFASWPGLEHVLVREMEDLLIAKADVLVATSAKLYERLASSGKPTHLLTHGVDLENFAREPAVEHACLTGIPEPRACYFGLFDERSDQELIYAVARRAADRSFVFAGPVVVAVDRLRELPNVYFVGALPYAELPALVRGCDALFIPYVVNELTNAVSPLKLNEYLATGRPVIATPLKEMRGRESQVTVAAAPEEWLAALREAPRVDLAERKKAMVASLEAESWARKAELLEAIAAARGTDAASHASSSGVRP